MDSKMRISLALLAMYFIWGSTYLAVRIALESMPPLMLTSTRLLLAGGVLYVYLMWRRETKPTAIQWRNAFIVGGLMLGGGVGGTAYAEQWVESGLAAVLVATVPLWATLFAGIWERWPSRIEWMGLIIGLIGVIFLNGEENLRSNPVGALIMLLAPISWAFGSVLSRRLQLPKGPMAFASEMLAGGLVLFLLGLLRGESFSVLPTIESAAAWLYLSIFGSLVAFSAYMYLLQTVSVTLATSYAYVNPIVAVLLGVVFAGESLSLMGVVGMAIILAAVVIITFAHQRPNIPAAKQAAAAD
ncbi:MAG: drug/metabolite exporter YedA [Ardenticatenaceae bacterium]|nr:drug/metabolite exporter YedA [Ardenticatenaceae bacterium]